MRFDGTKDYVATEDLKVAVNAAITLERPLLVKGEPGTGKTLLWIACGGYMLCAVFRLARYNILTDDQVPTKIFFGFPTTLAGGMLAIWMLLLLKYDPQIEHFGGHFGGAKLFGDSLETPLVVSGLAFGPATLRVKGYGFLWADVEV